MTPPRQSVYRILLLGTLLLLTFTSSSSADKLCSICDCQWSELDKQTIDVITCQTTNRKLFDDDLAWPKKKLKRINLIEFRDMLSSVVPIFKCDKEVGEIKFDRSDLKGVDKQSLGSLPLVEKFSFATNGIEKLSPGLFEWNDNLKSLNFSQNKLEDLPNGIFAELGDLSVIDLSWNRFQILSDKLIDTLKGVLVVNLSKNTLYAIDQVDFGGVKIEDLDLSENSLRFLKSSQFQSFKKLKHLNLRNNFITDIQDDAFANLDSLIALDLSNNQLLTVDLILPKLLTHLNVRSNLLTAWPIKEINAELKTVDLHNNTLEIIQIHGPETIHIEHLIVSHNFLEDFPDNDFHSLKNLDLSYNKFESIPTNLGKVAPRLDVLNMSGNPIDDLHFDEPITVGRLIFKDMPMLQEIRNLSFANVTGRSSSLEAEPYVDLVISHCPLLTTIEEDAFVGNFLFYDLDLSYNELSNIPQSMTNWSLVSGIVNLQGNPISCHCEDEWMITEILNKLYEDEKSQYLLENLRCGSPEKRHGVRLVRFYRHINPFCGGAAGKFARLQKGELGHDENGPHTSGFQFGSFFISERGGPAPWLIIAACGFCVTVIIVVGTVMQRQANQRRRNAQRKMLFSDL